MPYKSSKCINFLGYTLLDWYEGSKWEYVLVFFLEKIIIQWKIHIKDYLKKKYYIKFIHLQCFYFTSKVTFSSLLIYNISNSVETEIFVSFDLWLCLATMQPTSQCSWEWAYVLGETINSMQLKLLRVGITHCFFFTPLAV